MFSAALADRLSTLGLVAAPMGHEIRNPNHVIALNVALLESLDLHTRQAQLRAREEGEPDAPWVDPWLEKKPAWVQAIRQALGQIDRVVENLRVGVPTRPEVRPLDLTRIVRSAAELYGPRWRESTSRLTILMPPVPVMVLGVGCLPRFAPASELPSLRPGPPKGARVWAGDFAKKSSGNTGVESSW